MFTGIVETEGKIIEVLHQHNTLVLTVESAISNELKIDQSLAHNGICLTVTDVNENKHTVCAVQETIQKTTIAIWKKNDIINLERCMKFDGRLDGHIVQGHVDAKAVCVKKTGTENNHVYRFSISSAFSHLIIEKGSVCINGTSLTCYNVTETEFDIAVIPYTYEHTSIRFVNEKDEVNIEFDVIGKYIERLQRLNS